MSLQQRMKYPVAETFHSLQGEGTWAGAPMKFIRLAGCNVGTHAYFGKCTAFDGQQFTCDTDYAMRDRVPVEMLLADVWEKRICVTGGEPFLHDLSALAEHAWKQGLQMHVETSGTRPIPPQLVHAMGERLWISCSPKSGFLADNYPFIDEWKFLVGEDFDEAKVVDFLSSYKSLGDDAIVYLQPVNGVTEVSTNSVQRCLEILHRHPNWCLSPQLHKLLKVR
jgi:7-carboxy-7-deazaguanine synthase